MKAIFVGSIADGFTLTTVVEDAAAHEVVTGQLAASEYAEALDVQDPATFAKSAKLVDSGVHFVVYGNGLANGFTVFGPFAHDDDAETFAEANRNDNEWELFEIPSTRLAEAALSVSLDDLLATQDRSQLTALLKQASEECAYDRGLNVAWNYWHYGRHAGFAADLGKHAISRLFCAAWQIEHRVHDHDNGLAEVARDEIRIEYAN